jgi:acetyl esterase/lipase
MSWQMRAIAVYLRPARKPSCATADAAVRRHFCDVYSVRAKAKGAGATNQGSATTVIHLHGGAYVNEIQSTHWKLISHLATQLGCSVVVPIYGLAPSRHAADALTPVGTNRCASSRNAPTGIGKLGLPGDLSSGVTPGPGG